jgi:hypothetical protein
MGTRVNWSQREADHSLYPVPEFYISFPIRIHDVVLRKRKTFFVKYSPLLKIFKIEVVGINPIYRLISRQAAICIQVVLDSENRLVIIRAS